MVGTDTILKVVAALSTRPQVGAGQMENWTNGIEGWTAQRVTDLAASYTGSVEVTENTYVIKIEDQGLDDTGERRWSVYPKRTVAVTVDDVAAWQTHLDAYYRDLQAEIRIQLASAPVAARLTVLSWHLHLGDGVDELEP